jgi:hypothetical protein
MASPSTKDIIEGSYLTCFLMLGGEIMEAITWASALTYDDNKKFQDGINCKSSMGKKKKKTHGSKRWKPSIRVQEVIVRKTREESTTTNLKTKQKGILTHNPSCI